MVKRCQNEECGKAFTPARRDAKFCSERCRGQANARRARAAKTVAAPAPSEGRLEAIEARLEHIAQSLETRLDALERSVKAARVEASQALKTVTDEQGREREAARKSARELGGRLDALETTVKQMRATKADVRAQQEVNGRLDALEGTQNELVNAVNRQHEQVSQIDEAVAELIEAQDDPRGRRRR
ncbi:hypothetical protein L6R46_31435 [Myxococcota bacterium]|nr:hypothetical protein [Myxococcota bacterium]